MLHQFSMQVVPCPPHSAPHSPYTQQRHRQARSALQHLLTQPRAGWQGDVAAAAAVAALGTPSPLPPPTGVGSPPAAGAGGAGGRVHNRAQWAGGTVGDAPRRTATAPPAGRRPSAAAGAALRRLFRQSPGCWSPYDARQRPGQPRRLFVDIGANRGDTVETWLAPPPTPPPPLSAAARRRYGYVRAPPKPNALEQAVPGDGRWWRWSRTRRIGDRCSAS
eukprot:gene5070-56651_t